jgi:hypothetical protein
MEEKICMNIGSKKFMLDDQYEFYIFSRSNQNFIIYNDRCFDLDDTYNFPEIKNDTYPIKGYCKFFDRLQFRTEDYTNHQIRFLDNNRIIKEGSGEINISDGSKLIIEEPEDYSPKTIHFQLEKISDIKNHTSNDIKKYISNDFNNDSDQESINYDDLEIIKDMDKIQGIQHIDSGSYRKVFKIVDGSHIGFGDSYNNKIIKVAKSQKGIEANKKESNAWDLVESHSILAQYFAPVLHTSPDGKYLIMETCDDIKSLDSEESVKIVNDMKDIFGIYTNDSSVKTPDNHGLDVKIENIGKFDDRYVLFDYPYDDFLD